jgi:hypothetical protein
MHVPIHAAISRTARSDPIIPELFIEIPVWKADITRMGRNPVITVPRAHTAGRWVVVAVAGLCAAGCSLGPRSIEQTRLQYNEAVKVTTEQQLLLNIVRLRYTDTPSSLALSAIADQQEVSAGLKAIPFFTAAAAGDIGSYRGNVLPQAELSRSSRPTLSYTPIDDQEFTRRLFTPISLEGMTYLAKTTWPISTVFRLWLENLNWVPNAETGSGPTPKYAPEYVEFLNGIQALQRLQDRKLVTLFTVERDERLTDGVAVGDSTPSAAVEAVKAGFEYRRDDKGEWAVVRKKQQPLLRVGTVPPNDPDFETFCHSFGLNPEIRTFELTTDKLDPFKVKAPAKGLDALDMETRSLLQVLFFAANGVEVPPAHIASGVAPMAFTADGTAFDWDQVLGGLFKVKCAVGKKPPTCAHVAVCYRDHWFYIDEQDRDSKSTFALLVELSRLELTSKAGVTPLFTLPLGR